MKDTTDIILMILAGIFIGLLYYGGLWLTVKRAVATKIPALWFGISFIFRTGIALAGFYFLSQGSRHHLLECIAGFIIGKFLVTRFTGSKKVLTSKVAKG